MLWVVLAMGLFTHLPIRQVFKQARRLRQGEASPPRSSLCEARKRLGVAPVKYLVEHAVHPLATPETPGAFWRGWRWVGIDGSVYDAPDSPANAAAFSRASEVARPKTLGPREEPHGPGAVPALVGRLVPGEDLSVEL